MVRAVWILLLQLSADQPGHCSSLGKGQGGTRARLNKVCRKSYLAAAFDREQLVLVGGEGVLQVVRD